MSHHLRIRRPIAFALATGLLGLALEAHAGPPVVAIVEPLALHYGPNEIPCFTPDGMPATIVMAHRENGNAHSNNVYLVYTTTSRGAVPGVPEVIDLQADSGDTSDLIRDEPFDGEAEIEALRFARVRIDGHPATALVRARRRVETVRQLTDPASVELSVWQLDGPADRVGRTPYAFHLASRTITDRRYCNATSALHTELDIAYPDGWDEEPSIDGCPTSTNKEAGLEMLQHLDATSFPNSTGPRRRAGLRTFADYGFTQVESFADGWSYASEADHAWTVGLLVLDGDAQRKLLCVTDVANGGTYRSTAVVEVVPSGDGSWQATGRTVQRADCAAR